MIINETSQDWKIPVITTSLLQAFPQLESLKELQIESESDSDFNDSRAFVTDEQSELREFITKKVVMSNDRKRLFGVFSKKAIIIPHQDYVEMIDSGLKDLFGQSFEAEAELFSYKNGAQIKLLINLPDEYKFDTGLDDTHTMRILAFNSYDRGVPTILRVGTFRKICSNGAVVGDDVASIPSRRFVESYKERSLDKSIARILVQARRVSHIYKSWINVQIPYEIAEESLTGKLPKKLIEPILNPLQFPMSKYEFYNMLTARSTHDSESYRAQMAFDQMISNIFYGKKGPMADYEKSMAMTMSDDEIKEEMTEKSFL